MASPEEHDIRYQRLEHTLRLYRGGLLLCLLLLVVLAAALLAGGRHRVARAIRLNGVLICLVSNQAAAQQVRERLLEPVRRTYGANVVLREQWEDLDWPAGEEEVLTIDQAAGKLASLVTPLVCAVAIRVDDQQAVIVLSRDTAEKVLKAAQARFIGPGEVLVKQDFGNQLDFAEVQVPPRLVEADISRAVDTLLRGSSYTRTYTVRKGDTPEQIASSLGLPLSELLRRLPAVAQCPSAGTKLQVKISVPPLKVISIKEVVVDKRYQEAPQIVPSSSLKPGERRQVSAGEPGVKRVRAKQTWENGKLVRSVLVGEAEIVKPAIPARIEVGQAAEA